MDKKKQKNLTSRGLKPVSVRLLQKPVLEKPSTTLGELKNSGLLPWGGPEKLTLQAVSPEQRGYRVFIHQQT